jgi:hypothetical protein
VICVIDSSVKRTTVLTKMPTDCTALTRNGSNGCTVAVILVSHPIMSNKKNKSKSVPKAQPKKSKPKAKKNKSVLVPKPQSSFGEDLGSLVGKGVTSLAKWLGVGAYSVNNNTIIGAGGSVPSMHSTNDSIIVRHREYVGDVISSTTFSSVSIPLNPGIATSYPWLSKIASAFQQYSIKGMVIEYIPEVSEIAANEVSLGFVVLAAEYRTDLPSFPSLNQALESQFAVSVKPNCPSSLAIECDPNQSPYKSWYVRTNSVPSGEDVKTFDFVNLNVLVGNNQTGSVVLGQIWNTYEIELYRPTAFLDPPNTIFFLHAISTVPTSASPMASYSIFNYINPIGTNQIGSAISGASRAIADGFAISSPGTGQVQVTLPRGLTGAFVITFTVIGASTASVLFDQGYAVTNASKINTWANNTSPFTGAPTTAETCVELTATYAFSISNAQATSGQAVILMMGNTLVIPGSGQADLTVCQLATSAS